VHTLLSSDGTRATSNTYAGALYASWLPGAFVFNGRVAGGPTTSQTSRVVTFPDEASENANGSVSGWGVLAAGEAGYRLSVAGTTLEPYAGIAAQTYHQAALSRRAISVLASRRRPSAKSPAVSVRDWRRVCTRRTLPCEPQASSLGRMTGATTA
jgi:hypothetical protein